MLLNFGSSGSGGGGGTTTTAVRNMVLNGAMRSNQVGSAVTLTTPGGYSTYEKFCLDTYQMLGKSVNGSMTLTMSKDTDAPSGFSSSLKLVTDTGIPASIRDYLALEQFVPSERYIGFLGASNVTMSFWIKSTVTGVIDVSMQNKDRDWSYSTPVAITASDTWQKVEVTIPRELTGTWSTGFHTQIVFLTCANYQVNAVDTWENSFKLGSSSNTDILSGAGNTVNITGIQLEAGDTATDFEYTNQTTELLDILSVFRQAPLFGAGSPWTTGAVAYIGVQFAVPMTSTPRLALITPGTYTDGSYGDKAVLSFYDVGYTSLTKYGAVLVFNLEAPVVPRQSVTIRDTVVSFDCRYKGLYN
ncbi:hypothetical protein UFOVP67_10 [uncultured Caudovirales phage]|uniref:Uncharacterized protein n=1 Tax=uncultured Caudovirales phage TaxID=2100421 RepID=A0A6J5T900_9CAUD|nr:hypothetical protein UFOVP67_10 [uncultured Caudovirales phage]